MKSNIHHLALPGFGLGEMVAEAIDFLRSNEPQDGYFVGFSGGKDSIVTLELCRMAAVKHEVYYTYTTIDPPEVCKFVREHYPQVHWLRPAKSFFNGVSRNAPPGGTTAGAVVKSRNVRAGVFHSQAEYTHRAKAKAVCEYCGCEFMTSRIRLFYGPVICFACRFSIFEYSASRERNEEFRHMAVVNTPCRRRSEHGKQNNAH